MKDKRGYTLIELVITLAVLGIMLTPIFSSFLESNRVNIDSRKRISANYLAQQIIEDYKFDKFISARTESTLKEDTNGNGIEDPGETTDRIFTNGGFNFKISVGISEAIVGSETSTNPSDFEYKPEGNEYDLLIFSYYDTADSKDKIQVCKAKNEKLFLIDKSFGDIKTDFVQSVVTTFEKPSVPVELKLKADNTYGINSETSGAVYYRVAVIADEGSSVTFNVENEKDDKEIKMKPFGSGVTINAGSGNIVVSNNLEYGAYLSGTTGKKLYTVTVKVLDENDKVYSKIINRIGKGWELSN